MKSIVRLLLLLVLASATPVFASTLWYNGDWNGVDFLRNLILTQGFGAPEQTNVYDDFIVPNGQIWNVTAVFSNDAMNHNVTSAEWEIRSGVSSGNGGILIASGTDPVTQVVTGRSGGGLTEYTITVSGLNVSLSAGTYWLTVAPVGDGFDTTTSGANAIGLPAGNDDNAFWNSTLGYNFVPTTTLFVGGSPQEHDFSMGVIGTVQSEVPEPGTLLLLGTGMVGVAGAVRRKVLV